MKDFKLDNFFEELMSMANFEGFGEPQDEDDGYREWSETIEKQNQEFQDSEAVIGELYVMDKDEVMSLYVENVQSKTE